MPEREKREKNNYFTGLGLDRLVHILQTENPRAGKIYFGVFLWCLWKGL